MHCSKLVNGGVQDMTIDRDGMQRSLRQCLAGMAELLYHHDQVLETVTIPHRGLDRPTLSRLAELSPDWTLCQDILVTSHAARFNDQDRLVLTELGRELLFDMYGQGAADCA
jgi:hypothetical protein